MAEVCTSLFAPRDNCMYTSCYCEENVWKLCEYIKASHAERLQQLFVIFVSNENRTVPLWKQRAAHSEEEPVVWDYHVFLIHYQNGDTKVYDLDTVLSFPCKFSTYSVQTFQSNDVVRLQYHRKFRIIPSETFLERFASDRSHMVKNGVWLAPPPSYPCIQLEDSKMNLDEFISMDPNVGYGEVVSLEDFNLRFT
ncbi:protein N-terminal glutamine amidohydrolase-like [Ptychodera flava]|uniref:protein N-terminal glutamine amidohydrolase-like n=1 Tax=Ptychodera flava TaxID=63121 RepID=UPI003969FC7A